MATTEEFLIQIGIDPKSLENVTAQLQAFKDRSDTTVTVDVQTNATQAAAQVAQAADTVGESAQKNFDLFEEGIKDVEAGLNQLKITLTAVAGAATLITGIGFAQAADESRNLARANVILQQTNEELAQTQAELRQIADQTGITYAQVSEALFDVASAGFAGQDALDAIRISAQAAIPAGIEVSEAFNAIATAMRNFDITADQAGDTLVRIADLTRGTLADVANAVALIGPTASQAGISLNELGAAFATVTATGQTGEIAATLLFNAIQGFLKPGEEAKKVFRDLEITIGDSAFQTQDLTTKIGILAQAAQEGSINISDLFSQRALRGINALIANTGAFATNLEKVSDSAGRVQEGLESFFQAAGPQLDRLAVSALNVATIIGGDLLEAIVPVVQATQEFITANRELIVLLTKIGLVVTALAATWLAYRLIVVQVTAAGRVLSGVIKAITAVLTAESGSIAANVTAWRAKLASEQSLAASPILKLITGTIAVLGTETGVVLANVGAWLKNIAARAWDGFTTFLARIAETIITMQQETVTVAGSTSAFAKNAGARGLAANAARGLRNVLNQNVATMSLAATSATILGTAIASWKIATAVTEWLELDEAIRATLEGRATTYQKTIATISRVLTAPVELYARVQREAAQADLDRVSELSDVQEAQLVANDALEKWNDLMAPGIRQTRAFAAAMGSVGTEIEILRELEDRGIATTEQISRRAALEAYVLQLKQDNAEQTEEQIKLEGVHARAIGDLAKTQEQWAEIVKKTNKEFEDLSLGGLAESARAVRAFDQDFNVILRRFNALNAQLGAAQTQIARTDLPADELEKFKKTVELTTQDIAATYETLEQRVALARQRLIDVEAKYVADLRQKADEQIRVIRAGAEEELRIQRDRLAETQAIFDQLIGERDRAINSVNRFIQQLEDAQTRREDPALAEQIQRERQFDQAIRDGIESVEKQTEILEAFRQEIQRLAGPTQEEIRLQKQLNLVREQIRSAGTDERGQQNRNRLVQQERDIVDQLAEAVERRRKREEQSERILERANQRAARAQQEFQARDEDIEFQREQITDATDKITQATEALETEEKRINDALDAQIKNREEALKLQIQAIEKAKELANITGAAARQEGTGIPSQEARAGAETATTEFREGIRQAEAAATISTEQQQNLRNQIDKVAAETDAVAKFMQGFQTSFQTVATKLGQSGAVLVPAAANVTQTFNALEGIFEPSKNALQDMVSATNEFTPEVVSFGEAVTTGMKTQAEALQQTTSRLNTLEGEVRAIARSGGGANGLPR